MIFFAKPELHFCNLGFLISYIIKLTVLILGLGIYVHNEQIIFNWLLICIKTSQ